MFRTLIAAALLLATASSLHAQTPTGSITGRVTDGTNLPVPGVTVTITSPNLQGTRTSVTSANGDYIFPSLPPGPYTVTVEPGGSEVPPLGDWLITVPGVTVDETW